MRPSLSLFVGLLLYIVIGVPRALWQDWRQSHQALEGIGQFHVLNILTEHKE